MVDVAHVTKIDQTVPPDKACLLGCGVSTGTLVGISRDMHLYFNMM